MEIWDAYYPDGTLADCNLVRGEPIPNGLYHLVSEILVRHADGEYLLMQRDPRKPNYGGFILLDKNHRPKVALHIENEMRWGMKKYKKLHPDKPLPHITPHVFRHTFYTLL